MDATEESQIIEKQVLSDFLVALNTVWAKLLSQVMVN
jgi:hypothetical protein